MKTIKVIFIKEALAYVKGFHHNKGLLEHTTTCDPNLALDFNRTLDKGDFAGLLFDGNGEFKQIDVDYC